MTSAYEEARELGHLGAQGAELLYRTVDSVRRFHSYPPPQGYERWDSDAVAEIAHDFFAEDLQKNRIAGVLLRATDDKSFAHLLETAVRNFMIDQLRKTDTGAAMRSLQRIVGLDPEILVLPQSRPGAGAWTLKEFQDAPPFADNPSRLTEAAFGVKDIRRARWRPDSSNRAPIAEAQSLQRVVHAILQSAQSPVSRQRVLDIVLQRFPLNDSPRLVELTEVELDQSESAAASSRAMEIWNDLSDIERIVISMLDGTVQEVADETGLSRSSAYRAMASARETLRIHLSDETDVIAVLRRLRELSASVKKRGTEMSGLTSDEGRER